MIPEPAVRYSWFVIFSIPPDIERCLLKNTAALTFKVYHAGTNARPLSSRAYKNGDSPNGNSSGFTFTWYELYISSLNCRRL